MIPSKFREDSRVALIVVLLGQPTLRCPCSLSETAHATPTTGISWSSANGADRPRPTTTPMRTAPRRPDASDEPGDQDAAAAEGADDRPHEDQPPPPSEWGLREARAPE